MSKKTRKFKTEVQQLLDLVIHSLYSKKEIFLRELISNASDAIDRDRFEALTDKSATSGSQEWSIRITPNREAGTLTISDNGIGMNAEEIDRNIGTIANSGTKAFLAELKKNQEAGSPQFIGQFGVGFYSAFMVADRVTVVTRRVGEEGALRWASDGGGSYSVEEAERAEPGTDVTLHLREGMDDYLSEWRLRSIVKEYSNYIEFPIRLVVTRTKDDKETVEEETLNSMKSIWKRPKAEITEEDYREFYHHVSHDGGAPLETIHFQAEGAVEFSALLFLPEKAPFDLLGPEPQHGIHLYVRNVFITDNCKELIPPYLRFVRGVVDSSDLPLNVSRELLQDDAVIRKIRKNLVSRVLKTLAEMKENRRDVYTAFFREFGKVIKEGLHADYANKDALADLMLYPSTQGDELVTLREARDRLPEARKTLYYLTADSEEAARHSPHLEIFREKEIEVLLMADPIDEWVVQALPEYDGCALRPIDRGEIDLGDALTAEQTRRDAAAEAHRDLLAAIGQSLEEAVKEVRFGLRLTASPCCLVADENALNPHMERILRAMKQEVPDTKPILELNPAHPLVPRLQALFTEDRESEKLKDYIDLLYNQALLSQGLPLRDPVKFGRMVSDLMVQAGAS